MDYIAQWAQKGYHVVFEGLMESNEVHRTVAWGTICPVHVIYLDTPLEDCFAYINKRRMARGLLTPVDPYHTKHKYGDLQRVQQRLVAAGLDAPWLDREAAFQRVCELLKTKEEIVPHDYAPSVMHMGDCNICGNLQDHPIHRKEKS